MSSEHFITPNITPDSIMPNGLNIGEPVQNSSGSNLLVNGWSIGVNIPPRKTRPLPDPSDEPIRIANGILNAL